MHYLRARIQGRVQGVGYRHFIAVEAARLGLHGEVRNLADGDVELIAEGDRGSLERLLDRARAGPPRAVVAAVATDWDEGPPRYRHFRIDA